MLNTLLRKVFGTKHERDVKRMMPTVQAINALEPGLQTLGDVELRAKTDELRRRLGQGAGLDEVLADAFAVCREAARRNLGMRHFDVQLIGGMVLHTGKIAEMATGEGKTLVATLPAYLNALTREGVHIVTVNDYLARRDAQWMGPVYHALGLDPRCAQFVDPVEDAVGRRGEKHAHPPGAEKTGGGEADTVLAAGTGDDDDALAGRRHGEYTPASTTMRPPTTVSRTAASPRLSGVTVRGSRSSTVMSAGAPIASTPPVRPIVR